MANIFDVTDPRGIRIVCTKDIWYNHILSQRPFMDGQENDVAKVLENPFAIYHDNKDNDRDVYYALRSKPARYLKVVVEIDRDCTGSVVTAFPADSPKPGEKWIWPPSND